MTSAEFTRRMGSVKHRPENTAMTAGGRGWGRGGGEEREAKGGNERSDLMQGQNKKYFIE